MPEQTWPVTTENNTMSDKELRNLTYEDSAGNVRPFPAYGSGAGVVQKSDGTIVDPAAYNKDINVGFTNPNLHRRIDPKEPPEAENPLDQELAPREYSLEIHGTNSYRTTTITVHDEDSTTSEIP
jgi:hypothetical protein